MNEFSRCCALLGVVSGASEEEVKRNYRDLVKVWHPDRFGDNDRLQSKAQETLKEINLAYEYLIANGFVDGVLIAPFEPSDGEPMSPSGAEADSTQAAESFSEAPPIERNKRWIWVTCFAALAVILVVAIIALNRFKNTALAGRANANADFQYHKPLEFHSYDGGLWQQGDQVISPPFKLTVNFSLSAATEFRLRYEFGSFVFNAPDNPTILFSRSPRSFDFAKIPGKGMLTPHVPHELMWEVTTTNQILSLDGTNLFQSSGDFSGIKGYASYKGESNHLTVKNFSVGTPESIPVTMPETSAAVPDDLLGIMVADPGMKVSRGTDGMELSVPGTTNNALRTTHEFTAPFTIRTKAKADGFNLRLFCGDDQLVFNWDGDPNKLRLFNPKKNRNYAAAGQGMLSLNEWHELRWEIGRKEMKVFVDGDLRWERKENFSKLNATAGIGTALGRIHVQYFLVDEH